jgi:hypothetical protein
MGSRGSRFGGRIGLQAAVGSGFLFNSPSAGEIPLQRRTLRSLYPIPPSSAATLAVFLKIIAFAIRWATFAGSLLRLTRFA